MAKHAILFTDEENLKKYVFVPLLESGQEDADWIIQNCKAAIIVGDLEKPELIECYNPNPFLGQKPYFVKRGD